MLGGGIRQEWARMVPSMEPISVLLVMMLLLSSCCLQSHPVMPQRGFNSQWALREFFWQSQRGYDIEQLFIIPGSQFSHPQEKRVVPDSSPNTFQSWSPWEEEMVPAFLTFSLLLMGKKPTCLSVVTRAGEHLRILCHTLSSKSNCAPFKSHDLEQVA